MVGISRSLSKVAFKQVLSGGSTQYGWGYLTVSEFPKLNNNQVNTVDAAPDVPGPHHVLRRLKRHPAHRPGAVRFLREGSGVGHGRFNPAKGKQEMAKIVLGKRPKNFKRAVSFDLPEGGKGAVEATFVYRTRTEFRAFVDELLEGAGVAAKGQATKMKLSLKEALERRWTPMPST